MIYFSISFFLAIINVLLGFVFSRMIKDWKPLTDSLITSSITLAFLIFMMEASNVQ